MKCDYPIVAASPEERFGGGQYGDVEKGKNKPCCSPPCTGSSKSDSITSVHQGTVVFWGRKKLILNRRARGGSTMGVLGEVLFHIGAGKWLEKLRPRSSV